MNCNGQSSNCSCIALMLNHTVSNLCMLLGLYCNPVKYAPPPALVSPFRTQLQKWLKSFRQPRSMRSACPLHLSVADLCKEATGLQLCGLSNKAMRPDSSLHFTNTSKCRPQPMLPQPYTPPPPPPPLSRHPICKTGTTCHVRAGLVGAARHRCSARGGQERGRGGEQLAVAESGSAIGRQVRQDRSCSGTTFATTPGDLQALPGCPGLAASPSHAHCLLQASLSCFTDSVVMSI